MKLPMRPAPRPIGKAGVKKSDTWKKVRPVLRPYSQNATNTPTKPPWKDMPRQPVGPKGFSVPSGSESS